MSQQIIANYYIDVIKNSNMFSSTLLAQLAINVLLIALSCSTTILPPVVQSNSRDKTNEDYESCVIDTAVWPRAPWLVLIECRIGSHPPQRYPASIAGPNLIASCASGKTFNRLFRSKSRELRFLPMQNYSVIIERRSSTQEFEVASVKLHPNLAERELDWSDTENDVVILVLKARILFSDEVRPICWPQWKNTLEMKRVLEGVDKLFLAGMNRRRQVASYYLQVYPEEYCLKKWRQFVNSNPNTVYQKRMCGHVIPPENQTYTDCVTRGISATPLRNGSVIGNQTLIIGSLNNFFSFSPTPTQVCHKNSLIYISVHVPEIAVWVQKLIKTNKNSSCDPASNYFCDTVNSCTPLSSLCDGHIDCSSDGSDESLKYCRAFDCCYRRSDKNASLGNVDVYPSNSKCSSVVDNVGDEDNYACLLLPEDLQSDMILVGSVVGGFVFLGLIATILTFVIVRRIRQRNAWQLSDEEVQNFFDGVIAYNTCEPEEVIINSCPVEEDQSVAPLPAPRLKEKVRAVRSCRDCKKFPFSSNIERNEIQFSDHHSPKMGQGVSGVVYQGYYKGKVCAVKVPLESIDKELFLMFLDELKVLAYIKDLGGHKNVISLFGAYTKEIRKLKVHVVLEYCSIGSLRKYLKSHRKIFETKTPSTCYGGNSPSDIVLSDLQFNMSHLDKWTRQIAEGMEFLSGHKIIHGDLAARNILLDSRRNAKISDFGLSRRIYYYNLPNVDLNVKTRVPWRWMPPEALENGSVSCKSDVWSFGVTLWEVFSLGAIPYYGLDWTPETVNELVNGMRLSRPEYASDKVFAIMGKCWNLVPEERPAFGDILREIIELGNLVID